MHVALAVVASSGDRLPEGPSIWYYLSPIIFLGVVGALVMWGTVLVSIDNHRWLPAVVAVPICVVVMLGAAWLLSHKYDSRVDAYEAVPRLEVAANPAAPVDALAVLAEDPRLDVRELVAGNETTDAETLIKLAASRDESVRVAVASNPATPSETLLMLARDPSPTVRGCVGANPSSPPEALAEAAART